jgi:hypothetical protein
MATITVTWDSSYEASPAGSDDPREGDNKIRELKTSISERAKREHYWTPGSDNSKHGMHLTGSAVAFFDATAPTTNPAGDTLGADDAGRLWFDSDANMLPSVHDGTAGAAGWTGFLREIARWSVSGVLSAASNVAPRIVVPRACTVAKVVAFVETPPSGGTLVLDVEDSAGSSIFSGGSLSIADGDSIAGTTSMSASADLSASDSLILDIDSLNGSPADLTITIEFLLG